MSPEEVPDVPMPSIARPDLSRPEFGPSSSGRARGAAIGALILLVGLCASVLLATGWRSSALNSNRKSFHTTATDVRTTLKSSLDASLSQTRTLSAIATMEPTASDSRFLQWYQQLKRRGAAPAGIASALIQVVPASRLAGFRRATEALLRQ
jgi:hypothetical protein